MLKKVFVVLTSDATTVTNVVAATTDEDEHTAQKVAWSTATMEEEHTTSVVAPPVPVAPSESLEYEEENSPPKPRNVQRWRPPKKTMLQTMATITHVVPQERRRIVNPQRGKI